MAGVKWIKIVTDIFSNRKIKQIEAMPDADSILVIWFKMLCLAGNINESGQIKITKDIPYTDEMLANEFGRPLNTVRLAISIFERFGMIEIVNDVLCVTNWEKYQNVESLDKIREQTRKRVASHRARQKQIAECNVTVTPCNATEREEEREEDIERDVVVNAREKSLSKIINHYENTLKSFPAPATIPIIEHYLDHMETDVICEAITKAAENGKATWQYTKGILNNWKQKGIKTVEGVRQEEAMFGAEKKAPKGKYAMPQTYAPPNKEEVERTKRYLAKLKAGEA